MPAIAPEQKMQPGGQISLSKALLGRMAETNALVR